MPPTITTIHELTEAWKEPEFVAYMARLYGLDPQGDGEDFKEFRGRCMYELRSTAFTKETKD